MGTMTATSERTISNDTTNRCDRCGAQAYVQVLLITRQGPRELLFCGHDWRAAEGKLRPLAVGLTDETAHLAADANLTPKVDA